MSTINTEAAPAAPLSAFTVENFTGRDVFEVEASRPQGRCPATVRFVSDHGTTLRFQADLKPDTARALAAALMILADTAEQYEFEATVQAELAEELAAA